MDAPVSSNFHETNPKNLCLSLISVNLMKIQSKMNILSEDKVKYALLFFNQGQVTLTGGLRLAWDNVRYVVLR